VHAELKLLSIEKRAFHSFSITSRLFVSCHVTVADPSDEFAMNALLEPTLRYNCANLVVRNHRDVYRKLRQKLHASTSTTVSSDEPKGNTSAATTSKPSNAYQHSDNDIQLLADYLYHVTVADPSGEFAMNALLEQKTHQPWTFSAGCMQYDVWCIWT
jgi:hypothetical protein